MGAIMVREFFEISGCSSIDALIAQLASVKAAIPPGASAEQVRLRGDDDFGRHILVTYLRPETPLEVAAAARAQEFVTSWCMRDDRVVQLSSRRV